MQNRNKEEVETGGEEANFSQTPALSFQGCGRNISLPRTPRLGSCDSERTCFWMDEVWSIIVMSCFRLPKFANWLFSAIFRQTNQFMFRNRFLLWLRNCPMTHDSEYMGIGPALIYTPRISATTMTKRGKTARAAWDLFLFFARLRVDSCLSSVVDNLLLLEAPIPSYNSVIISDMYCMHELSSMLRFVPLRSLSLSLWALTFQTFEKQKRRWNVEGGR